MSDEAKTVGTELAAKLVESLVVANENAKRTHEILEELIEQQGKFIEQMGKLVEVNDELCDRHEVLVSAFDILGEAMGTKRKLDFTDFVAAFNSAIEDVMGDEDDDTEGYDGESIAPKPRGGSMD